MRIITTFFASIALLANMNAFAQPDLPTFTGQVVDPEDQDFVGNDGKVGTNMDSFDIIVEATHKTASSVHKPDNGITYSADNAYDWNLSTAWVPKSQNDGVGEWLEYTYGKFSGQETITSLIVFNGYRKSQALWKANARVRDMRVLVNGKPYATVHLQDAYNYQTVPLGKIPLQAKKTVLRFEILSVYKGSKYRDVAISELEVDGSGVF
jgi:hypothetical protein